MIVYLLVPYIAGFILLKIFPVSYFSLYPYTILLFMALGMLFYLFVRRSANMGRRQFVNGYLLVTFLKFILSAILIVLYAWIDKESAVSFAITYFVFYVVLSIYEMRAFRRMSVKQSDVK